MKLHKNFLIITLLAASLTACKTDVFSNHISCQNEDGLALVQQIIIDDLNSSLDHELKGLIANGAIKDLDPAKLKLSAKNLTFTDSRTEFVDPNSPKTACAIDLSVMIPSDLVKKSDDARAQVERSSTDLQADDLGVNFENGKIDLVLEYTLQPTDKGDKVLATLKNTQSLNTLVSDTLTYAFLKPQIEKNQVKLKDANKKQAALEQLSAQQEAVYAASEVVVAVDEIYNNEDY